eukprot:s7905_g2.t1
MQTQQCERRSISELTDGFEMDKIAIPGDNDPVQRSPGSSRRRQSTGECWHLRNTWGDEWGDKGYFRFLDDMLTGPPGYHLHIASAAADGPKSVETVI